MKIFTQIMTPKIATIAEADEESDIDSDDELKGTTDWNKNVSIVPDSLKICPLIYFKNVMEVPWKC